MRMPRIRTLDVAVGCLLLFGGRAAIAQEVWHAIRTLLPGDLVRSDDVKSQTPSGRVPDALPSATEIVGLEVRRRIYAGHDVAARDVGTLTAVKAGAMITVLWKSGDLSLELGARALDAGSIGDEVRVLNPASLRTIRGTVVSQGTVEVRSDE
jgi:flagella basal body P-ring formation protein FlgA